MSAKGVFILAAAALASLSLGACERKDSTLFAAESTVVNAPAIPMQNYVGRWAVTADHCVSHPWVFAERSLTAGDGVVCGIGSAERSPAGYSLSGSCMLPSGELPGRLLVTFADVNAMTLTGGPYKQPVTLVRCGAATKIAAATQP